MVRFCNMPTKRRFYGSGLMAVYLCTLLGLPCKSTGGFVSSFGSLQTFPLTATSLGTARRELATAVIAIL